MILKKRFDVNYYRIHNKRPRAEAQGRLTSYQNRELPPLNEPPLELLLELLLFFGLAVRLTVL